MGLIIESDAKGTVVYRKDKQTKNGGTFPTYCIRFSSKDKNDAWQSAFLNVGFKKGIEVNNKAKIRITEAFFAVDTYNDKSSLKLMITSFKVIEEGEGAAQQSSTTHEDGFMDIPDSIGEDLPFV